MVTAPNPLSDPSTMFGQTVVGLPNDWLPPNDTNSFGSGTTRIAVPTANGIQIVYASASPSGSQAAGTATAFTIHSATNPISAVSATGGPLVTTTTNALQHGLLAGMTTMLSGFTGSLAGLNGAQTVVSVSGKTFTVAVVATGTYTSGPTL